jgi:hypothetical protein
MVAYAHIGLDPHSDTPMEILHVILLGVVKYFWRDAMKHLSDNNKSLVKAQLTSLDVAGMDPSISRVSGHTLV